MSNELTKTEIAVLKRNGLTVQDYTRRRKLGWSKNNALFLDKTFRSSGNNIYKTLYAKNKPYKMSPTLYYRMKSNNLNIEIVQERLNNGIDIEAACTTTYGEFKSDLFTPEEIYAMEKEKTKRKQSINYTNLLFAQKMRQFISQEEYDKCVKSR